MPANGWYEADLKPVEPSRIRMDPTAWKSDQRKGPHPNHADAFPHGLTARLVQNFSGDTTQEGRYGCVFVLFRAGGTFPRPRTAQAWPLG